MKCPYCGGVILVPPWMGGKTFRCVNHPERLAVGICNDCGRNFCGECLHIYHLRTKDAKAVLYLDTTCLRKRYVEKANKTILLGIVLLGYGMVSSIFSLVFGILFIICGVGAIGYGIFKGGETPIESTVDKALMERKRIEADPALREIVDAEKLYSGLLTQYVNRWGAQTELIFCKMK